MRNGPRRLLEHFFLVKLLLVYKWRRPSSETKRCIGNLKQRILESFAFIFLVFESLRRFRGWLYPIGIHFTIARSSPLYVCRRQVQRGWFSGWFNVWHSPWKRNSFPGQATLESQQGDMKQSQACDALPQYLLPFHSPTSFPFIGSLSPPPTHPHPCKSYLTGGRGGHFTSPISHSLWIPLPMMDELHTLGCLSLSIMPCD